MRAAFSAVIAFSSACAWHVGVPPAAGAWRVTGVAAPVAEPDVDVAVGDAVRVALAARSAAGETPLSLTVTRADFTPGHRAGAALTYVARLEVRFDAGARSRVVTVAREVGDPGGAGAAQATRAEVFRALAAEAAALGVAWLADGG